MKKLVILLLLLAGCGSDCDERALYEAIKDQVRGGLKSPMSATFAPLAEAKTYRAERICEIRVKGWVDAQNSFGAIVRSDFTGTAIQNANTGKIFARVDVFAR